MPASTKLPAPDPWDPKEVALALEDAMAHWAAGKQDEALHALARAAAGAEQASLSERARALHETIAELRAPAASPAVGTGRPPPPSATRASTTPGRAAGTASHAPPAPSARAAAAANSAPTAAQPAPADPATAVDGSNGKRTGLHVWVRTSARDPTLMLVRLLPDGHSAPPGAYEAYLSPMEEGVNLLSPKH